MKEIYNLILKYKETILYLFFGGLTTLVNIITYCISIYVAHIDNVPSTIIAWIVSVAFAYITNRKYVFLSKNNGLKAIAVEVASFVGCRLLTGILDVAIMYASVDIMHWNNLLWKILSNILVIVLNYIASKVWIFKSRDN